MERFSETGNVLLRYSVSQRSFGNEPGSSTSEPQPTPEKGLDDDKVDFNDVFGGPPRRFSMPENRYRLAGAAESSKPVFGGESYSSQRRHASDGFYDDIFMNRSNDSYGSPRWSSPTPGSRTLSPANSTVELLSSSVPAQLSLPAKLTKATDLPTFGSSSSPHRSPKTSLSRFSTQEADDLSNNLSQSPGQTLLSSQSSFNTEYEKGGNLKQNTAKTASSPSTEFHFSIHKWPGRGVPLLMSLRGGKCPTLKGSSKVSSLSTASVLDVDFLNDDFTENVLSEEIENNITEVNEHEVKPLQSVISNETKNMKPHKKEVNKSDFGSPKSGVKGKVKQFVKIFSPEGSPKTKMNAVAQSLSSRWKSGKIDNEVLEAYVNMIPDASRRTNLEPKMAAANAKMMPDASETTELDKMVAEKAKMMSDASRKTESDHEMAADNVKIMSDASRTTTLDPKMAADNVEKMPDASIMVEPIKKQKFSRNRTIKKVGDIPFARMDASSLSESIPYDSKVTAENIDDRDLENFQVQELSPDGGELSKTDEDSEALRASDSKIRLWSNGRKGNIRSLLSTLQYVLWPESGWKPVALVDIIETNAVKKAYNRAMLCLHPDKLQQKGAAFHQKYMAEKVFDILQEAWDQFNSLGTLM